MWLCHQSPMVYQNALPPTVGKFCCHQGSPADLWALYWKWELPLLAEIWILSPWKYFFCFLLACGFNHSVTLHFLNHMEGPKLWVLLRLIDEVPHFSITLPLYFPSDFPCSMFVLLLVGVHVAHAKVYFSKGWCRRLSTFLPCLADQFSIPHLLY